MPLPNCITRLLPWQSTRAEPATPLQAFLQLAPALTAVLTVLFGALPMLLVYVVGLARGTVPETGALGSGPGYPAFTFPLLLLWVPAVISLVFAIVSIPVSGAFPRFFWGGRIEMCTVAVFGCSATLAASIAYGGPYFVPLIAASGVWILALALISVRAALGAMRLLPQRWR